MNLFALLSHQISYSIDGCSAKVLGKKHQDRKRIPYLYIYTLLVLIFFVSNKVKTAEFLGHLRDPREGL